MSPLAAKILIVGVPLVISLAWFLFWVLRLNGAARRMRSTTAGRSTPASGAAKNPGTGPSEKQKL